MKVTETKNKDTSVCVYIYIITSHYHGNVSCFLHAQRILHGKKQKWKMEKTNSAYFALERHNKGAGQQPRRKTKTKCFIDQCTLYTKERHVAYIAFLNGHEYSRCQ